MEIIGARIGWADEFDNPPSFYLQTDEELPSDLIYTRLLVDSLGQTLAADQMTVVGRLPFRTGQLTEVLYAEHESGYVRFLSVGKETDYPRGGLAGTYAVRAEEGGIYDKQVASGWIISSAVVNNCDELPEICECAFVTPRYRNVAMAAFCKIDVIKEAVEKFLPGVEVIPTVDDRYTARIKGHETKETFRSILQVDAELNKKKVAAKLGVEANLRGNFSYDDINKILKDPDFVSIKDMRKYSDYLGQEFTWTKEGMECSLCGYVEVPDNQQKRVMEAKSSGVEKTEYFRNWCRAYHCCKSRG